MRSQWEAKPVNQVVNRPAKLQHGYGLKKEPGNVKYRNESGGFSCESVIRFGEYHLNIAQIPFGESPLAIAQIIFPHSDKCLGESHGFDLLDINKKSNAPLAQGSGIVRGDVLKLNQSQVGAFGN